MEISIYTDGACSGNPGAGGYAFYILSGNIELLVSGCKEKTTNNHMELMAIARGLKHVLNNPKLDQKLSIVIYSDSAYIINAMRQGWLNFWKANGWKTKANGEVKNAELWQMLDELILQAGKNRVSFVKVKAHNGNKCNELVDKAAKDAIKRLNAKA